MKSFVIRFRIIVDCSTIEKVTKSLARTLIFINCLLIDSFDFTTCVVVSLELNERCI